ncbi:MAG: copper chaperone PCu(A)C [Steroidobacteraceae bacterium]
MAIPRPARWNVPIMRRPIRTALPATPARSSLGARSTPSSQVGRAARPDLAIRPALAILLALAALCACSLFTITPAVAAAPPKVEVSNAWVPEPPPGADVAAAYFTLHNAGTSPAVLIAVSSPVAQSAMLHRTMVMHGESMMRPIERLTIAPGKTVTLRPDGMHVMLNRLLKRPVVGQQVPLVLRFASGAEIQVSARVRPLGSE